MDFSLQKKQIRNEFFNKIKLNESDFFYKESLLLYKPDYEKPNLPVVFCFLLSCKNDTPQEKDLILTSKLFLLSKGLVSDALKAHFVSFIGENRATVTVAVIPNAINSEEKMFSKTEKVKKRFVTIGFDTSKISLFNIETTNPAQLLNYDLIYILGGNPFLLLEKLKATQTDSILQEFAALGKTIMAYSAGVLILGKDLNMMNDLDDLLGFNEIELENLDGLALYHDFKIFPHYDEFTEEVDGLKEAIEIYQQENQVKLFLISDDQGIIYENGKARLIE